ncbi:MAG TPA: hypothetical protein VGO82_05110 [Enterovirga sp.]|nr:hypothetical protein [Enterovirga sp.]
MNKMMMAALGFSLLALPATAAETAAENFSYKAPSGMFSEGTTKWQMYQFVESDAERTAKLRAGETATGSLSNSNSNAESYPRPGEYTAGVRRRTSR